MTSHAQELYPLADVARASSVEIKQLIELLQKSGTPVITFLSSAPVNSMTEYETLPFGRPRFEGEPFMAHVDENELDVGNPAPYVADVLSWLDTIHYHSVCLVRFIRWKGEQAFQGVATVHFSRLRVRAADVERLQLDLPRRTSSVATLESATEEQRSGLDIPRAPSGQAQPTSRAPGVRPNVESRWMGQKKGLLLTIKALSYAVASAKTDLADKDGRPVGEQVRAFAVAAVRAKGIDPGRTDQRITRDINDALRMTATSPKPALSEEDET